MHNAMISARMRPGHRLEAVDLARRVAADQIGAIDFGVVDDSKKIVHGEGAGRIVPRDRLVAQ